MPDCMKEDAIGPAKVVWDVKDEVVQSAYQRFDARELSFRQTDLRLVTDLYLVFLQRAAQVIDDLQLADMVCFTAGFENHRTFPSCLGLTARDTGASEQQGSVVAVCRAVGDADLCLQCDVDTTERHA